MSESNQKDYSRHIQILEKAKDHLWDRDPVISLTAPKTLKTLKTRYVCIAISWVDLNSPEDILAKKELYKWINKSIDRGSPCVISWLSNQLGKNIYEIASRQEIQAYRLAWINQMIQILKEN